MCQVNTCCYGMIVAHCGVLCFFLLLYTVCAELTGILAQSPVNTLWYRAVLSGELLVYVLLIKLADHDTGAGAYPSLGTRSLL